LWSAIYPYRTWGQRPQFPQSSSCLKARKMSVPRKGTLAVFSAHRAPEGDPHIIHSLTISKNSSMFVNFGELSVPLILAARRPALRPPYGDGSCWPEGPILGPCHKPSHNPLRSISYPSTLPGRYFGELSAPLVQKQVTRGSPTPLHLSGTSSDERSR
jgi:hypothetical protein